MNEALFTAGPNWIHNALIHHNYDDNKNKWEAYVIGYRVAADSLADKVINEVNNRDTLIFPIVFLYRQYLELRFKEIIENGGTLLDAEHHLSKSHDLIVLWSKTKNIIQRIWPATMFDFFESTDNIINEFNEVDQRSDGFRYPINKNGEHTLKALRIINLKAFRDMLTPVISAFEEISLRISIYQSQKDELQGYHTDYFEAYNCSCTQYSYMNE
jgi:hypothetical protein